MCDSAMTELIVQVAILEWVRALGMARQQRGLLYWLVSQRRPVRVMRPHTLFQYAGFSHCVFETCRLPLR